MNKIVKILHLEDLPSDAELIKRELNKGNLAFELCLVENKQNYERALDNFCPDIIISDHSLPSFDSLGALAILKEKKLNIPFILVTSAISEEFAVLIMKQGADDYILKDRLQRLPNAVLSALEKKRIEAEHQKFLDELIINEAVLKEAQALAHIGNWVLDFSTGLSKWSDQLCRIYGVSDDENIQSYESWLSFVHPEDLDFVKKITGNNEHSYSNNSFYHRIIRNDGTIRYIHTKAKVQVNSEGKPIGINGIAHDITDEKKAEISIREKELYLRGILDSTDNGIIAIDNNQCIINFNSRFTELWQIPPSLMHEKDISILRKFVSNQLTNPEEFIITAQKLNSSDGTSFDTLNFKDGRIVERFSTPLILNNKMVGRVLSYRDITERRKYLLAIEEQNKELVEIAWIQSHVVRAPLSRILGIVNLIKTDPRDESDNLELLNYLFISANELDDIIRSIVLKTQKVVKDIL